MPDRPRAASAAATARLMWARFEPVHAISYFAAESRQAFEQEDATDQAGARPWARLGRDQAVELDEALRPVARACAAVLPFPHPVGTPGAVAS